MLCNPEVSPRKAGIGTQRLLHVAHAFAGIGFLDGAAVKIQVGRIVRMLVQQLPIFGGEMVRGGEFQVPAVEKQISGIAGETLTDLPDASLAVRLFVESLVEPL
jgi:hypothetical protein